jgi:NADH-quinone oxidoreductase subunit D
MIPQTEKSVREITVDDLRSKFIGVEEERAKVGTGMNIVNEDEHMLLSMGPQHPSTHGVLRLLVELEGEKIINLAPDIGYLHTGIEKNMEAKTFTKALVMTDRMDYLSPMSNNLGYIMAVEKLIGVEPPPRAVAIRTILVEMARISSHLVWLGTHALDLAAMSVFLYCFREREYILDVFEMCSGQRMMVSYFRPGGLWRDVPEEFEPAIRQFLDFMPGKIADYEALLTKNPIWMKRTKDVGLISGDEAIAWGVTGPSLRASGVDWDLRRKYPYMLYDQLEFDVPVATAGDVYARYQVRMEEMRQSLRIIRQVMDKLPAGPFNADDRKFVPPPRAELGRSMEAVIHHFKLWTEGFSAPDGYVFQSIESPRGEFGCYLRGNGGPKPMRVHFRAPSYVNLASLPLMAKNLYVADLVSIIGSVDIVLGEIDR